MFDMTQLSDDELRAALFDALVERLDLKALEDPSITIVNRMPTAFSISRRGNLLTLSQGIGLRLLRGDLRWKDRREQLRTFNVGRATIQSRLAITPDRIEGTADEILDRLVAMFLEWTAPEEKSSPPAAGAVQGSQPAPLPEAQQQPATRPVQQKPPPEPVSARQEKGPKVGVPRDPPSTREAIREQRPTAAGSTPDRPSAAPRPTSAEVTEPSPPAPQTADALRAAENAAPRREPIRETTTPALRTYQLLFETARREFDQVKVTPNSGMYSLISAGVFVALTAEAFLNDLGSRVIPSWSQLQRLDPREKAEVLSIELFNAKVDWAVRPFQSVAAALGFRRALAHAHAETLAFDQLRARDRKDDEVPRTRRTAWQEHCDVATIQRWIVDVRLLIEHFSRAHDPTVAAAGFVEQASRSSDDH